MPQINNRLMKLCETGCEKLADPFKIEVTVNKKENFVLGGQLSCWVPYTLGAGHSGLLLLFSELETVLPNKRWRAAIRIHGECLVKSLNNVGVRDLGLFTGLSGVCLGTLHATRVDAAFSTLHQALHDKLLDLIPQHYPVTVQSNQEFHSPSQWNVLSGISGILSYLLSIEKDSRSVELIKQMLSRLVSQMVPRYSNGEWVPGWIAPSDSLVNPKHRDFYDTKKVDEHIEFYRYGHLDTGISHGVSGCLAILSQALIDKLEVEGHRDLILRIVEWLRLMRQTIGEFRGVWPKRFGFIPGQQSYSFRTDEIYDGWNYGAPGILHALLLASKALQDPILYQECCDEIIEMAQRSVQQVTLDCPSFAYGWSGLLTLLHQFEILTGSDHIKNISIQIEQRIVDLYLESHQFGFQSFPPEFDEKERHPINNPGLLFGAAGVFLSLLFFQSSTSRPWTKAFAIF